MRATGAVGFVAATFGLTLAVAATTQEPGEHNGAAPTEHNTSSNAASVVLPVFGEVYSSASVEEGIRVGEIRCNLHAHDPHKGTRDPSHVAAGAYGDCKMTAADNVRALPPPEDVAWELRASLLAEDMSKLTASHARKGFEVAWQQDSEGEEALVHNSSCVNGRYRNEVAIYVSVPFPWHVAAPVPFTAAHSIAEVSDC